MDLRGIEFMCIFFKFIQFGEQFKWSLVHDDYLPTLIQSNRIMNAQSIEQIIIRWTVLLAYSINLHLGSSSHIGEQNFADQPFQGSIN